MSDTEAAIRLAQSCYPIFAGQPPTVQGAALCELVARHVAGHVVRGDAAATAEMRRDLLTLFMAAVEAIIPVVDDGVIQPELRRRSQ